MKKPPSKLRLVVRELQLALSLGCLILIIYALLASAMVLRLELPQVSSPTVRLVLSVVISHGLLLLIAPALCFGTRMIIDINPWRLGLGSTLFVEFALVMLRMVSGGFDEDGFDAVLALQIGMTVLAGLVAGAAANAAAKRVAKNQAAPATATPNGPGTAAAAAPDFAAQMRQAQEAAAKPADAPPAPNPPNSEPPKG